MVRFLLMIRLGREDNRQDTVSDLIVSPPPPSESPAEACSRLRASTARIGGTCHGKSRGASRRRCKQREKKAEPT